VVILRTWFCDVLGFSNVRYLSAVWCANAEHEGQCYALILYCILSVVDVNNLILGTQ